jgi:Bacterial antitoxin of type II TA system, VapB
MCAAMRTTLILDDQLFRRAKREAGDKGATLSELVNTALRSYFFNNKPPDRNHSHFIMPVFGESGLFHQTAEQLAELRDEGR